MKIGYIVHDLRDMAVARRKSSLESAGFTVQLTGFLRTDSTNRIGGGDPDVDGLVLAITEDGNLARRSQTVLSTALRPGAVREYLASVELIIARNLEALAIAIRVARGRPVVYECLDIHRMLLGNSIADRGLQLLEAALLRRVDLIIVSSPAFAREYFARKAPSTPVLLLENKVPQHLVVEGPSPADADIPYTIGWFGMLRCSKTLAVLSELVARLPGKIQVVIAGKPSTAEFPDFAATVAGLDGIEYLGPYRPADLRRLYALCDFAWCIDWFEDGLNSEWLLPNRLYEASAFGAVPIALAKVETGRWLEQRSVGLVVEDVNELVSRLANLSPTQLATLRDAVAKLPSYDLIANAADERALKDAICAVRQKGGR